MSIIINHLQKQFGDETVLANVTISALRGQVIAVVGPSAAGKTTILNIVAGILAPDAGTVVCDRSRPLGYMLQEPALLPWRTLVENARLGLELTGKRSESSMLDAFLQDYELGDSRHKYPSECSLGMQQRTALIRTLVVRPGILLLDEPFSSLDYDIKLRAQISLAQYVEEMQPSVLLVTHDIEDAIALADKVIVLSAKPAIVKAEIVIELGLEKRDPIAARTSPKFQQYFQEIWGHLKYLPC
jgi:NitT/TauT family transport system ATP-binding protein